MFPVCSYFNFNEQKNRWEHFLRRMRGGRWIKVYFSLQTSSWVIKSSQRSQQLANPAVGMSLTRCVCPLSAVSPAPLTRQTALCLRLDSVPLRSQRGGPPRGVSSRDRSSKLRHGSSLRKWHVDSCLLCECWGSSHAVVPLYFVLFYVLLFPHAFLFLI